MNIVISLKKVYDLKKKVVTVKSVSDEKRRIKMEKNVDQKSQSNQKIENIGINKNGVKNAITFKNN